MKNLLDQALQLLVRDAYAKGFLAGRGRKAIGNDVERFPDRKPKLMATQEQVRSCSICGGPVPKYKRLCSDKCRAKAARRAYKRWYKKQVKAKSKGRCVICGGKLRGKSTKYCKPACQEAALRLSMRALYEKNHPGCAGYRPYKDSHNCPPGFHFAVK